MVNWQKFLTTLGYGNDRLHTISPTYTNKRNEQIFLSKSGSFKNKEYSYMNFRIKFFSSKNWMKMVIWHYALISFGYWNDRLHTISPTYANKRNEQIFLSKSGSFKNKENPELSFRIKFFLKKILWKWLTGKFFWQL